MFRSNMLDTMGSQQQECGTQWHNVVIYNLPKAANFSSFTAGINCRCVGLQRAAARLESGFDALCVYGSSKTDKDLVFTAHALQVLEQQMLVEEQQRYRLVMRPGMPVPGSAAAALDDDDASASKQASLASSVNSRDGHAGASHDADADQQSLSSSRSAVGRQQRVLTWRRYYHSQLAAVYSMLYRTSVPKLAHTAAGTPVEHDFAFVK